MGRTRVVGPVGSLGPRYGVSVRKKARDVLLRKLQKHECPFCASKGTVYRVSTGIWACRKCGNKWAGAAYTPRSEIATYMKKYIAREEL